MLANTAAGCGAGTSSCGGLNCVNSHAEMPPAGTAVDNDFVQTYVDVDGDATTYMSSSDSMNLASCSNVTFAGLYWGAGGASTTGQTNGAHWTARNTVKLKVNNGTYQTLTADNSFDNTTGYLSYHNFKDITSIVAAAGTKGRFTVANMPLLYDASTTVSNRWGGWAIVIVYKNDLENFRNLNVFNGLTNVAQGANNTTDLTISGFFTPPNGPITLGLGVLTYDGDRGFAASGSSSCPITYKGDSLLFNGAGSYRPISDAVHPANDVFNSSIANNGVLTPYRNPSYNNTLGHDASIFFPNNTAKNLIGNSASTATIRQKTGGETFITQVVTFAVDVYEPDLRGALSVVDLNGGTVVPGDTLEYTATIKNIGSDPSTNTYMIDTLPSAAVYVPGSIRITAGPNSGAKTDAAGDDQGEYIAASRAVKVRIGTGANAVTGGIVLNSLTGVDSTQVKFRCTATTDCVVLLCDTHIDNKFDAYATGQISHNTFYHGSNPGIFDASGCPIPGSTITNIVAGTCPQPTASNNTPICAGNTINLFSSNSNVSTYSWAGPNGFTSTLQNPTIPNSTVAMSGTYTVSIHPTGTSCYLTATTTVVINPTPSMTNASTASICTGGTVNIPLTSSASATYTWIGSDNPNVTGEITTLQTSNTLTNTLFNATLLPQTVTYTVTPTGTVANCPGIVQIITVTVNPLPNAIATPPSQTICSGSTTSIALTSTTPGATFSWTVSQSGVTGATGSSGSTIAQTITDTSPAAGSATYTVTPTASTCVGTPTTVVVTITHLFVATFNYSGTPYCQNAANPSPTFIGAGTAGHFTSSPAGLSINANTGVVNLAASNPGTYTVTNSFAAIGACTAQSATATITITALPIATFSYTGTPYCQNGTNPLPTFSGGGVAGAFSAGAGLNFVSTSTGQINLSTSTPSTYTVTNTVTGTNGCPNVTATTVVTINPAPSMTSASTVSICSGNSINLPLTSSVPSSYTWITTANPNTTGESTVLQNTSTIDNVIVNTTNVPQTLTYTVTPTSTTGGCLGSTQSITVTINPKPNMTSASSATICSGGTVSISLTSDVTSAYSWIASNNPNTSGESTSLQTSNTLSDVITNNTAVAQTVTYTVTPSATVLGSCPGNTQTVTVTVNPSTTANAGGNGTICSNGTYTLSGTIGGGATSLNWTTSGSGTFDNALLANATYTPSPADITFGSVTLTITTNDPPGPCSSATDAMVLTINPAAIVNAGTNATICAGNTYTLSGSVAGGTTSTTWTTSGSGTFDDASLQNPTYTPSPTDITNGSVTLTITSNDPSGPCPAVNSAMILTINPVTIANAGADAAICQSTSYTLSGSIGGSATTLLWTTSGSGSFNNAALANAIYTPSIADNTAGSVTLYITTNDPIGPCSFTIDSMLLTINPPVTANAGVDATICAGDTYTLSGSVGGGATSSAWTTNGSGTFDNAALPNATYTPSSTDISNGSVTLTITTNDPSGPCQSVSDAMILNINPAATANAGADASICQNSSYLLSGSIGGSAASLTWSSSGTGTFDNINLANATYTPSANDITAGTVTLTITTNDPVGICPAVNDNMILSITPNDNAAFLYTTSTFCKTAPNPTPTITGLSGGTFTFTPAGLSLNNNTGTINLSLSSVGNYTIFYTTNGPCPAKDSMNITITTAPIATFSYSPSSYCQFSSPNPLPSFTSGASAGVFTAIPSGLVFVSNITGEVDLQLSSPGNYTVTNTIAAANGCSQAIATSNLTINAAVIANAGSDAVMCSGSPYTLSGSIGGGATSLTWTTTGTGLFNNATLANATYTPSAADNSGGSIYLILNVTDPAGFCPALDSTVLTINSAATVNAGISSVICAGSTFTLNGTFGGSATSATWSSSGTGTFDDAALTNATYTPSLTDVSSGSVILTLTTNNPSGPCDSVSDAIVLTINSLPIANAGPDASICSSSTYSATASIGGSTTSVTWSTSGTGTFNNSNVPISVYTPSAADIAAGSLFLIVTSNNPAGPCNAVVDSMLLTINMATTVSAGTNAVICSGSAYLLSGTFRGGATSANWNTSGSGTFNDPTLANATYTPSAADISSGSVILTLTTNDPSGPCNAATDAIVLTINPLPTANAGPDATICSSSHYTATASIGGSTSSISWSTSGTGTFNNPNIPTTTYTPSAADISAGSVFLIITTNDPIGPCNAVKDSMLLTINSAATVSAGLDVVICNSNSYTLSGSFGGGATSSLWTTSGTGTFDNATLTNATYSPSAADIAAGNVILTITTDDPAGVCSSVSDFITLTINHPPIANAGPDDAVCANSTYNLSGSFGGGAISVTWGTTGTGSFNNVNLPNATYTPSASDISAGSVILFITTNDPPGPCSSISDSLVLTINPPATANAGIDDVICSGSTYNLSGSVGGSATSLTWITSGSGTFNNTTIGNATYTPSANDITLGNVTLTITSNDPAGPCPSVSDAMVLTINQNATTNAGANASICANSSIILAGTIGGGASSLNWTSSGSGTFNNPNSATATYTPSVADIAAVSVTLTITTNDPAGPCTPATDAMILTITPVALANAGSDDVTCAGNSYTLSGAISGSATSGIWSSSGTGTFNTTSLLNAVYTPSGADIIAGSVTLTLTTNDPPGPCPAATDAMILTINPNATVNAGIDGSVCANSTYSLSGTYGGSATSATWTTLGTGTFSNQASPNSTYTPSASDIATGSVHIIYATNDPVGVCLPTSDTMLLTINPLQIAAFIYSSSTFCLTGTNQTPVISGVSGGTFFSTPVGLSINSNTGTITLSTSTIGTYTITYATPGPCPNTSTFTVTITTAPSATFSYNPTAYCQNSGSSATPTFPLGASAGTFSAIPAGLSFINVNTGVVDLANSAPGTYTVTNLIPASGGCASATATNTISIGALATANAGVDAAICSNVNYTLSGTIGGSASSLIWITSGTGTFNNPSIANATYTPSAADIAGGSVTLTINTDDPAGACPSANDALQLTILPAATVNAGADAVICGSSTYALSGIIGGGATSAIWTTSGTGSFNNINLVNAIYTPSAADINAGSVTLTLTTNDPAGPCPSVSDAMTLTFNPPATANAGADAAICSGNTYALSAVIGGAASSLNWTTSGTGNFNNVSSASAIYTPSAADISAGSVTLTITTNDPAGICAPASDNLILTINPLNVATFTYPGSTFCQTGPNPTPTFAGSGAFTSSPVGLTLNSSTGTINLASSTAGTYTITNFTSGLCPDTATATVTITTSFNANFGYSGSLFCQAGSPDPLPTYIGTGSGGIFTVAPAGLVVNNVTGEVNLAISAPGNYIVTNTISASGGCAAAVDTGAITITAHDNAAFSYSGNSFCNSAANQTPTITGLAGGTFIASSPNLVIDASTGIISMSASQPGAYSITYTTNGICPFSTSVPFTITPAPDASFSYGTEVVFCINSTDPIPTLAGVSGIFSASPAGITVNASTGEIILASTIPGTYVIKDSISAANGCSAAVSTTTITITPLDDAGFNYSQPTYCLGGSNPTPTITGISGGVFSSTPVGLTLNSATGEITIASSIASSYTITYATAGSCPNSSTQVVNIIAAPVANAGRDSVINCGQTIQLNGASTNAATYFWTTIGGTILSGATTLIPTISAPGTYILTVTNPAGCQVSDTVIITGATRPTASFTTNPNPATGNAPLDIAFSNTSTNATSYIWDLCSGCPTSITQDASYIYNTSGTYTVYLVAINGTCRDTASTKVIVSDSYSLTSANVFTPNDDGINDIFNFKVTGVTALDALIYDRWGLKMYEWTTVNGGWDGHTVTGLKAAEGTYFYIVTLTDDIGNEHVEKGSFMLMR